MSNEFIIIDDIKKMAQAVCKQISLINEKLKGYQLMINENKEVELAEISNDMSKAFDNGAIRILSEFSEDDITQWHKDMIDKIEEHLENNAVLVLIDTFLFDSTDTPLDYSAEQFFSAKIYKSLLEIKRSNTKKGNNLYFFMYSRSEDVRDEIKRALEEICKDNPGLPGECYARDAISFVTCTIVEENDIFKSNDEDFPLNIPKSFKKIIRSL